MNANFTIKFTTLPSLKEIYIKVFICEERKELYPSKNENHYNSAEGVKSMHIPY